MTAPVRQSYSRVVTEDDVHSAMEYLRSSAESLGKARTRAQLASSMIKHVEALEFKKSEAKSSEAKKADARTSQRYVEAIHEEAIAVGELAKLYAYREAAAAKIEAWRTESATIRSMKV